MTSIFHKFIEVAANKPQQTNVFPEFAFMQYDIRKSYKQLKESKGITKPNDDFQDYWKQVGKEGREEQVGLYFRWIELLRRAISGTVMRQLPDRQSEMYVRKSLIGKWDRRKVKLNGLSLQIFSKHLREYPLKCFGIRKSKNKQHFSWVMQVIMQCDQSKYKSFHLGTNNIIDFQQWYRDVENRIDLARVQYFKEALGQSSPRKDIAFIEEKKEFTNKERLNVSESRQKPKTLTELIMDKELKQIQDFQELEVIEQSQAVEVREEETHPNIFHRLFPKKQLQNFSQNPINGILLQIEKQHRCYQVQGKIKIFITIGHNISNVFRAISQSHRNWNPDIDVFTIKNKIGSQNSVLAYQKDKSKGFLYRERDYLFLRHCFSIELEDQRKRIFMIQKSIDSIHTPPFMTVARGEKELIWCLVGDADEKECLLVVEGLIKGGGYMNAGEDKQTTIKQLKKLLQLQTYLKQVQYSKLFQDTMLFRENWVISLKEQQQQQFYSPREFDDDQRENKSNGSPVKAAMTKQQEVNSAKKQKHEEQFDQFMKQTNEQHFDKEKADLKCNFSAEQLTNYEYVPPQFDNDRTVIIPKEYLKIKHRTEPRPKGKQHLGQVIRGHHLWKGQWAINQNGGLNYVDEDKMREQKKVLTFIIKRIGKNILSGKGILNISLPVDIFCRESNIERLAASFGYCPIYLEKVVHQKDPIEQLKAIMAASMGSSLIYLTMEKPFNPILGETYQCWIDGCPVYFQQISHHPPIAAYFMKGRGYQISGSVQAKMDLSINSGTGINEGIFTVKFDNGRTFYFTTPPGELCGLTYGERKLCMVDKTYFWSLEEGIFLELTYNPLSKQRGFFGQGGKNLVGEQRLADYLQGVVKYYRPQDLKEFFTPKKNDMRRNMAIPRSSPTCQVLKQGEKVHGRWTKSVHYGSQCLFDIQTKFMQYYDQKNPLPSHSNYREDVVYRKLNNFVLSQQFKQILQVKQRKDRKLREQFRKKNR